jgi:hypothetical protein
VAAGTTLSFTAPEVLSRIDEHGDLFAGTLDDELRARVTKTATKAIAKAVTGAAASRR